MYNSYQLAEWIAEKQVSVLHLTPALGEVIAHQASGAIDSIRRVFVTGEVLRTDTAQSLLRLSPLAHIFNCYGTSETQRAATYYRVDPDEFYGTIVFSGLKTKDTRVRIVNANNEDCALGEVGQVCIESHHLALGYLNENEASKAKFKPQQDGSTRYLTGDLGVPVNDHSFKYLGRADNQVNIRGFRIEIEEVEVNLKRLSEVSNASVTIIESQYLVAYIVPAAKSLDPAAVIESIKLQLRDLLPDYMLPKHYMFIDKIPLTENGKVNKVALPLLEHFNHEPAREQPKTDLGLKVRSLWSKLLEIDKDQISLTDNFFELGGHSLLLIKLITNIKTEFGLEIGIKTLFEINDLASMIQLIESMHNRQQVNRELAQVKQDEIEEVEF
jgi:acyl-coenzyme A synthetase/AMP-(fatty) acid ligase/acyl carrier protein